MVAGSHTLGGHFLFKPLTILNMKEVHDHSFNVAAATAIGHEKAILLKELYYWCQQNFNNKRHFHHGLYWTYNTAKAFTLKFPYFSERSIGRWLQQLEQDGYIGSACLNKKGYDRTKWYCVNEEAYVAICEGSKPGSLEFFKKYLANLADSNRQNGEWNSQNGDSFGQNGEPIPPLNPSPNQSPFIEPEKENELLITTKEEFEGMGVTTIEILPIIPSVPQYFKKKYDEEMKQLQKEYDQLPKVDHKEVLEKLKQVDAEIKASKKRKYIYPPTQEELIPLFFDKLTEKKRQHPQIIDCWNWANMEAEKFFLHWERKGWTIQRLPNAIATWVNGSITYGTVTKPCPIQYKNNPDAQQPTRTTQPAQQERPVLTQYDIEATAQNVAGVVELFKNMGVRI